MNYTKNTGWYYNSINDRSPSWSGVEFLYKFENIRFIHINNIAIW